MAVVLVCLAVAVAGCTNSTSSSGSSSSLTTSPTDAVPANNAVTVTVQEKVYDGTIPVVFNGGRGQGLVKSIDVTVYRSDGQVEKATIGTNKDDSVKLQGTKDPNKPDRVVVYVTEMNGQTYKVADELSAYRQH
ncbi:hypothetical protein [Methanoregula sp. UBA64]|uniref:hypothetical protein n=1 Tax=Methanoregula sp. UBA64 TaxID=1915554 RepID=UPI0025FE4BA2|nr:hypothetical protein [Methanoregula sp. UBA64]